MTLSVGSVVEVTTAEMAGVWWTAVVLSEVSSGFWFACPEDLRVYYLSAWSGELVARDGRVVGRDAKWRTGLTSAVSPPGDADEQGQRGDLS